MVHVNKRSESTSKERIIKAATKVFSENGYEKSSMRMIAKTSHISTGGLYLYFRNKEDLYLTIIKFWMDNYSKKIKKVLYKVQEPVRQIRIYIAMSINYSKKYRELILLQGRELGLAFSIDIKRKFYKEQTKLVEDIILRGITAGVFRGCNVKEAARVIQGAIRGFILSIIVEEYALFSPDECSNLILHGLMKG
jgi:AcrR family transcriptional regulator